ncbi:hypothetical protein Syun_015526 [Stephania yunnanensis]|uniref:Uncharacterized protein n=1 Tax=Stephania yunnanensis TaxID=152371 RepID=A0AAP0PCW7_9MAGN
MLQQPREAGEVADFGPAGGGYAEATAVQQQVAGGIVSSWTAAAAACQRLQPRGSRRVTRTRATRLQRRRSAAERMVRLVRTAAGADSGSNGSGGACSGSGAAATPAWLRRDERRGGALSADRRRDFDKLGDAMNFKWILKAGGLRSRVSSAQIEACLTECRAADE